MKVDPIKVRKFNRENTLKLTIPIVFTKEFALRLKIGVLLMRLAAWVFGMSFKVGASDQ